MTTKIALLPRLLPGLFGRAATVSSAGYRMPHQRLFFYGIGLSAAVHAAVLMGFNTPLHRDGGTMVRLDDSVPPRVDPFRVDLEKIVPPPPKAEAAKTAENTENADSGRTRATIAERFSEPSDHAIVINIDRYVPAVRPRTTGGDWVVPKDSGAGLRATGGPIPIEDLDEVPVVTTRVSPRYPAEAKRLGLGGTAVLRFVVDARGNVAEVEVVRADYAEFGKAATEALLKWKFKPGLKNRRKVDTLMEIPMSFALEKSA